MVRVPQPGFLLHQDSDRRVTDMKPENDEVKRRLLRQVAEDCANRFEVWPFPDLAFNFPVEGVPEELAFPVVELHIRMPAWSCLPRSLKPPEGQVPTKDELMTILRSCPAIENLRLRPEFQRYGFLNALLRELARVGTPYVLISNIENHDLALHYLELSRCSGSGVELTSPPRTVSPTIFHPTFAINLGEVYRT